MNICSIENCDGSSYICRFSTHSLSLCTKIKCCKMQMQMQWNLWKFYDMTHARFIQWMWVASNFGANRFFHKTKEEATWRERHISKINFVESLSNKSMRFHQIFRVVVCRYYITTYRFTIISHLSCCNWRIFATYTALRAQFYTFYAPNKTWNYFFQSNKDKRVQGTRKRLTSKQEVNMRHAMSFFPLRYANFTRLNSLFSSIWI